MLTEKKAETEASSLAILPKGTCAIQMILETKETIL